MADKIGVTELNKILKNSIPNIWSKQAYVQGFYCKSILLKKYAKMFVRMEIAEIIYEGVVTPSYKKLLGKNPNVLYSVGKIEDIPPCQIPTPRRMVSTESSVNNT